MSGLANRLLGYPPDARLLIVNADDFGMCHSVNAAIMRALTGGILQSATLMVPCPWALHAMRFLAERPEIRFGVHLTAISDWADYRWGPVASREKVPSLVDRTGFFYDFDRMPELFSRLNLTELELEFRAQIETVLAAGLHPTHLDWHALRINGRNDVFGVMTKLALEYGLALRVMGADQIAKVQSRGLPTNDYDFLDSYLLDTTDKTARYIELLRGLPAGLSEWAIHPGISDPELMTIDPTGHHIRQADFDFLISQEAKETIEEEGIILLDYQALQTVWQEKSPNLEKSI